MNNIFIDETISVVNGAANKVYIVHGNNCAKQLFTSFYEAERYVRLLKGFYGVDENLKTYKQWTY